jgi:hypothetical protein
MFWKKTNFNYYIDKFHDNYAVINLDEYDVKLILEAQKIGNLIRQYPSSMKDELNEIINKYKHCNYLFLNGNKYFVRTDRVSLKYGCHGEGPYSNFKQIIESIAYTTYTHTCIKTNDKSCKIYLLKRIDNLDHCKEFRIFVNNNKITAISQQYTVISNMWLNSLTENGIEQLYIKINEYFNNVIMKRITHVNSYVIDLCFIYDNMPYFIEINPFGKEYSSESSLFHWINDNYILYGKIDNIVTFRYTV